MDKLNERTKEKKGKNKEPSYKEQKRKFYGFYEKREQENKRRSRD